MLLRLAGITKESVVDGPGIRYVIYVQGCTHNCVGCHNIQTHDMHGGYEVEIDTILNEILNLKHTDGVTFSGGEPFLQAKALSQLAINLKNKNVNIVSYTGYLYEQLLYSNDKDIKQLLSNIDILIDGPYIQEQRDLGLTFRGSKNQRIINLRSNSTFV